MAIRDLNAIKVFVDASVTLNFTQTAKNLHMTPSAISRSISKLESDLSTKLFVRSTRKIGLTREGTFFLQQAKHWLAAMDETTNYLTHSLSGVSGKLKISMPVGYGHSVMQPLINEFLKQYPNVSFEIFYTDDYVDFISTGLDAAIRIGNLEDSELVALQLSNTKLFTCASPDYLKNYPQPEHVNCNLPENFYLGYLNSRTGKTMPWQFLIDGKMEYHKPRFTMALNDGLALIKCAADGAGLVQLHDYLFRQPFEQGKLVRVWQKNEVSSHPVNLVFLKNTYQSKLLRVFIDFLRGSREALVST